MSGLLAGRIAVVTGGAGGIGGAVSRRFAAEGATVVANDIDAGRLASLAEDIPVLSVPGDIRDPATVAALVTTAHGVDGGRVDVLVNNVGDYRPAATFLDGDEDQWEAQYAVNLAHVFRCTKAVLPTMIEHRRGSIVNVSTVEALRGFPAGPVYSAFKAAVIGFTRSLAADVGRHGIRVNAIAPDLAITLQTTLDSQLRGRDPAVTRHWSPLGRLAEADEFADVVVFLASDLARFVTGTVLPVDGGVMAAGGWLLRRGGRSFTARPDPAS
jgi:NAD(P)-dependent dehydrogenase (short-subunit alcohol dehydrogenase family)